MNRAEQLNLVENVLSTMDEKCAGYQSLINERDEIIRKTSEEEEAMDRLFYGTTDKKRSKGTQEKA